MDLNPCIEVVITLTILVLTKKPINTIILILILLVRAHLVNSNGILVSWLNLFLITLGEIILGYNRLSHLSSSNHTRSQHLAKVVDQ